MKHEYTTVHDLKDILNIYHDCEDYRLVFWNFIDQRHETLAFSGFRGFAHNPESKKKPHLDFLFNVVAEDNPLAIKTVGDLKKCVNAQLALLPDLDEARVHVYKNNHNMNLTFSGSSNVAKTVHYSVEYEGNYRAWKRWWNWKLIGIKFFLSKVPFIGKHMWGWKVRYDIPHR